MPRKNYGTSCFEGMVFSGIVLILLIAWLIDNIIPVIIACAAIGVIYLAGLSIIKLIDFFLNNTKALHSENREKICTRDNTNQDNFDFSPSSYNHENTLIRFIKVSDLIREYLSRHFGATSIEIYNFCVSRGATFCNPNISEQRKSVSGQLSKMKDRGEVYLRNGKWYKNW